MDVNYDPLWKTMKKKNITQYRLMKDAQIDYHTMDSIRKGANISTKTLGKICAYLECTPNDVIRFI